jgi:hypothetical protein
MRIGPGLAGVLGVLVLAVSACGGDSGASADASQNPTSEGPATEPGSPSASGAATSSGPLDVCSLLTPDDLQQAFGSSFGAGERSHQDQTGADQCVWSSTSGPPVRTFSITVLRQGSIAGALEDSGMGVKELHASARAAMGPVEQVDLGEDAYRSGGTLAVLDGDSEYTFSDSAGSDAVAGIEAVAREVVG